MLNVDGWTDGRTNERTNGRKLARLCLPAKAGATKREQHEFLFAFLEDLRLYSETKLILILDSNSSKYRSSVVGVGLARV